MESDRSEGASRRKRAHDRRPGARGRRAVWLIACVNASNLLIARVASRRRELSVRTALGASRGRVLRHLLVESALLATGSAIVGVALAAVGIDLLRDFAAAYFPRTQEIALDGSVLPMLAALTAVSTSIFGLIPALHGLGARADETLHATERFSTGTRTTRRLRQALVGTQSTIATPLLVTAMLLLLSLNALRHVDLGFDARNLISGSIRLPSAFPDTGAAASYSFRTGAAHDRYAWRVGDRLRRQPSAQYGQQSQQLRSGGRADACRRIAAGHAIRRRISALLPGARPLVSSKGAFWTSAMRSRTTCSPWSSIARGRRGSFRAAALSASAFVRADARIAHGPRWSVSSATSSSLVWTR